MARVWKQVDLEVAQAHPLFGVGGWLLFYGFSLGVSVLTFLAAIHGLANPEGMGIFEYLAMKDPLTMWLSWMLFYEVASALVVYMMMATKHVKFRPVAIILIVGVVPFAFLTAAMTTGIPALADLLIGVAFKSILPTVIWVAYLQRSKRVRVTFEHLVLDEAVEPVRSADVEQVTHPRPAPTQSAAQRDTAVDRPSETAWATALTEFEGADRRQGAYAQAYSEAGGNESAAKARYLERRAQEIHAEARATAPAPRAGQATQTPAHQEDTRLMQEALAEKGQCPSCKWFISHGRKICPYCDAQLGAGSAWDVIPLTFKKRVTETKAGLAKGRPIQQEDVEFLAAAAAADQSIIQMWLEGNTLLHIAAGMDLAPEVEKLLAAGADAAETNSRGETARELATTDQIKALLATQAA